MDNSKKTRGREGVYRAAATGGLTGARLYTVQCTPCTYTSVCKQGPVIKLGREAPYSTNVGTELTNVGTELKKIAFNPLGAKSAKSVKNRKIAKVCKFAP